MITLRYWLTSANYVLRPYDIKRGRQVWRWESRGYTHERIPAGVVEAAVRLAARQARERDAANGDGRS